MKIRPIRLMTPTGSPVRVRPTIAAAAGHAGGEVGRAQELGLPRNVVEDFLLVPDVIARRHHVDAIAEDGVGDVAGHAKSRGGVLDVGDDEIDVALLDERGDGAPRDLASGLAEDVADEQDAHVSRPAPGCGVRGRAALRCAAAVTRSSPARSVASARAGVERAGEPDPAGESAERALGDVEGGVALMRALAAGSCGP